MNSSPKQCAKCMECFRNMTASNTTSLSLTTQNLNQNSNATNHNRTGNSSKKILFCKSKALFFKKVNDALHKNEKGTTGRSGEVAMVQTSGKSLSQFMDKDCFADSSIDENQLYNVEFTVAII